MSNFKIDKALKKALSDWESPVDGNQWKGISQSLNSTQGKYKKRPVFWMSFTGILIGIASLYLVNINSDEQTPIGSKAMQEQPVLQHKKIEKIGENKIIHNDQDDSRKPQKANSDASNFVNKPVVSSHSDFENSSKNILNLAGTESKFKNNNFYLPPHNSIFASMLHSVEPSELFEKVNPYIYPKSLPIRPKKNKDGALRAAPEILFSGGVGYVNEKLKTTTTTNTTHRDYQKVWDTAKSAGLVYNAKIEYFQPIKIKKIGGLGISAGLNYIQSFQKISVNYTYSDIPVRDSASNQILGYVKLPNNQQEIVPNANVKNTELALSTRLYFTPIHTRTTDIRILLGTSIDIYSQSKGNFYDIDKAAILANTRKHRGVLIPEWGIAGRIYLSDRTNLSIGYNGRISIWELKQYRGSIRTQGIQQNIQIGLGFIF